MFGKILVALDAWFSRYPLLFFDHLNYTAHCVNTQQLNLECCNDHLSFINCSGFIFRTWFSFIALVLGMWCKERKQIKAQTIKHSFFKETDQQTKIASDSFFRRPSGARINSRFGSRCFSLQIVLYFKPNLCLVIVVQESLGACQVFGSPGNLIFGLESHEV